MSAIMPPTTVGKTSKGKGRKASKSKGRKAKSDLKSLGLFWGQVGGAAAVASAAKGYLGDKMDIMGKVDGRLAIGAAGTLLKLSGKAGAWDGVVTNVTTGVLTSWLAEKGFDFGQRKAVEMAPAPAPTATQGIVVGNIYGQQSGAFWQPAEKRLEKKLAKIKAKADKKDIEWSDITNEGEDNAPRGGGRIVRRAPVLVAPPRARVARPWFRVGPRPRAFARR